MATPATRALRSDGIRSRDAILRAAASFASVHGLQELTLGELADAVGMSKSGLYAHFGSKEELQLATVGAAREIFSDVVLDPAAAYPTGVDGLVALADAFCEHIRDKVFPGGCFFDSAAADVMSHPGPVRDAVMDVQMDWRARFQEHLRVAAERGELPTGEDIEQLEFELLAFQNLAHSMFRMNGDGRVIDQAERATRVRLGLPADYRPVRSR
jgi:AcrR family transcriptional regulator